MLLKLSMPISEELLIILPVLPFTVDVLFLYQQYVMCNVLICKNSVESNIFRLFMRHFMLNLLMASDLMTLKFDYQFESTRSTNTTNQVTSNHILSTIN